MRSDENKQASILANALPISVLTDIQRRLQPVKLTEVTFSDLEKNLVLSFGVKKSFVGAAVSYLKRKQRPDESIEEYAKGLNQLASKCNYKECCRDRSLRDHFLSGLRSTKLLQTLITECENKTFHECVERAKLLEQVTIDVEDINPASNPVNSHLFKMSPGFQKKSYFNKFKINSSNSKPPQSYKCIRCGKQGNHFAHNCYALKKTCNICSKTGHLSHVCKSRKRSTTNKSHHLYDISIDNIKEPTVIPELHRDVHDAQQRKNYKTKKTDYAIYSLDDTRNFAAEDGLKSASHFNQESCENLFDESFLG